MTEVVEAFASDLLLLLDDIITAVSPIVSFWAAV